MKTTKLEIMTPGEMIYEGDIESLIVETVNGSEGYMPGHIWCVHLMKENGKVEFREPGTEKLRELSTQGGFVEIRDTFTVYTEKAEWK